MTDRKHIEQLAAELGVTLHFTAAPFTSAVDLFTLNAYIEPFQADEDDQPYLAALHELGHVASEQFDGNRWIRPWAETLANEANAWRWAFNTMRRPLSDSLRIEIAGGLGSYFRRGIHPEGPQAGVIRALLVDLGEIELPWPKTNEAFQAARAAYLRTVAA